MSSMEALEDFAADFKDKDTPRIREVPYKKNAFLIQREDPFGFYGITLKRGPTPDRLTGKFTSYDQAEIAVNVYISEHPGD